MSRDDIAQAWDPSVDLHIDYARELNAQQHAAVTAPPGPVLVIAGAGSGKTRTLVYRVGFLLENGIPPERILLLTFTNKAAKEMMRRVTDLLGRELDALWGGTFHSIGNRILRAHAERAGFRRDFGILDRDDANDVIKACIGQLKIDTAAMEFPKPAVLAEIFSLAVNTHLSPAEVVKQDYEYFVSLTDDITRVREQYAAQKRAMNAMDFDDLLALWLRLFKEHPDVCEFFQRRFQFILVDEYQDTNPLQGDLIDLLAARHHNVMVVGDDAQSIYAWRGADYKNILNFPERYPEARTFKIETNYRSTPEILDVANAAIAANIHQFQKTLTPARKSGSKPVLVTCWTADQQAEVVVHQILKLREDGMNLGDIAVLYRSHFHAVELQLQLTRQNVPFSITSGVRFFEQAHVKDVAAYLRFIANPADELAFKRIVQLLPGIGAKAADKLWARLGTELQSLAAKTNPSPLATALQIASAVVPKKSAVAWAQFTATISQLETPPARNDPSRMIDLVIDAGYEDHLKETYPNYRVRLEDLKQLALQARRSSSVEAFLSEMALATNLEAEPEGPAPDDADILRLSTIHQAKGLEFDAVFIIMLCDDLFPVLRAKPGSEEEEEERRLLYVAITRARNELYLCHPLMRAIGASGGDSMLRPSRLLKEIPMKLLEECDLTRGRPYGVQ
jgi:DNA helicase II / ATP-dependent DNA helicase PcrA